MKSTTILSLVLIIGVAHTSCLPFSGSCDSCGRECQSACGTRGFRTCCLNYLKKRSTPVSAGPEANQPVVMLLPELAQYYPSVGLLIPAVSNHKHMRGFFRKGKNANSEDSHLRGTNFPGD